MEQHDYDNNDQRAHQAGKRRVRTSGQAEGRVIQPSHEKSN